MLIVIIRTSSLELLIVDEEEEMDEEIDVVQSDSMRKEITNISNVKSQCSSPLSVSFGNADELLLMLKQFRTR